MEQRDTMDTEMYDKLEEIHIGQQILITRVNALHESMVKVESCTTTLTTAMSRTQCDLVKTEAKADTAKKEGEKQRKYLDGIVVGGVVALIGLVTALIV